MVTALALSTHPSATSVGGCEQENKSFVPLVALADWTTRTVAVLASPRLNSCSSTTHKPTRGGTDDGSDGRGSDGSGEEGTGGAVRYLRLVSVRPCREKVTSLIAASGTANLVDSDDGEYEDGKCGADQEQQQHQQQKHPHQHMVTAASRFAGDLGRNRGNISMFLVGTTSGAVSTFGVGTPSSATKSPGV